VRALKALLKVLFGLTLGLALAEGLFRFRDAGAFPHLNLYTVDPTLGVRLEPNTSMKLRVANNAVTTVQINSLGYRAPEWPAPASGEVLVVGDSQVFGLGVESQETFSARLSELLKVPVLNAGVPTYGPREYTAVVKEVLARRKVATVVYVLNLSNDLFEVDRPNLQRHTVWDGWAVRTETAPSSVTNFPFRRALMSRSHLVFAARKLLLSSGQPASEGFATEGSWKDVVQASNKVEPLPPEDAAARQLLETRGALAKQLEDVAQRLESHFEEKVGENPDFADAARPLAPKGGDPRDILEVRFAEGARRVDLTAYHLFMASVGEAKNEAFLEKLATSKKDPELQKLVDERKKLRGQLDALRPEGEPAHVVPVERVLQETKALCDAAGARLLVVALPLDVMVSADEWKKYGVPPLDMSPTKVLVEDLVTRAERAGALGLDPTAALAAAEPGAFLDGDLHLTPRGHAALAQSIAEVLSRPVKPKSTLALPEGRSWYPTEDEWRREKECTVKGSTAAHCETKLVREWLRVRCLASEDDDVDDIEVLEGGHGDWRAWRNDGSVLILPVVEGDSAKVRVRWEKVDRELTLDFPKGGARTMAFAAPVARVKHRGEPTRLAYSPDPVVDPLAVPGCDPGSRLAGAMRTCAKACDAKTPCDKGHCEPWPTGDFCAVP
jgi:lysophospholipase L1-like esterase